MALNIIQIPLFLFIRGVKIAFSASCFHAASAIVFLTEVHTDNLAGYKILQLQQILGKFCINKWGTKKVEIDGVWKLGPHLPVQSLPFCHESRTLWKLNHSNLGHTSLQFLDVSNFCCYKVTETWCFFKKYAVYYKKKKPKTKPKQNKKPPCNVG